MTTRAQVKAWADVAAEMVEKELNVCALACAARLQAQQTTLSEFKARYTGIAEDAEALAAVYLALAEHARAELAKLQPTMQGERVKP